MLGKFYHLPRMQLWKQQIISMRSFKSDCIDFYTRMKYAFDYFQLPPEILDYIIFAYSSHIAGIHDYIGNIDEWFNQWLQSSEQQTLNPMINANVRLCTQMNLLTDLHITYPVSHHDNVDALLGFYVSLDNIHSICMVTSRRDEMPTVHNLTKMAKFLSINGEFMNFRTHGMITHIHPDTEITLNINLSSPSIPYVCAVYSSMGEKILSALTCGHFSSPFL